MLDIFVDADACPVKDEIYRVATRYQLQVFLVSNSWMRTPNATWLQLIVVNHLLNAADDWIAEHIQENDVLITGDIPLASRCIKKEAHVLTSTGRILTKDSIGDALATRDLLTQLRDQGAITGGPAPFQKQDRSRFLQRLNEIIQNILRKKSH